MGDGGDVADSAMSSDILSAPAVLPPAAPAVSTTQAALAVVQRLARSRQLPPDLLEAVQGPLGAA